MNGSGLNAGGFVSNGEIDFGVGMFVDDIVGVNRKAPSRSEIFKHALAPDRRLEEEVQAVAHGAGSDGARTAISIAVQ